MDHSHHSCSPEGASSCELEKGSGAPSHPLFVASKGGKDTSHGRVQDEPARVATRWDAMMPYPWETELWSAHEARMSRVRRVRDARAGLGPGVVP